MHFILKMAYLTISSPPGPEVQMFPISSMSNPSGLPISLNFLVKLVNRRGLEAEPCFIILNSQSSWLVTLQLLTTKRSPEIAMPFGVTKSFVTSRLNSGIFWNFHSDQFETNVKTSNRTDNVFD